MIWITENVANLVRVACRDLPINVSVTEFGGDYDTQAVSVIVGKEGTLWIRGFRTDEPLAKHDMVDVEMVEVTDGKNAGGLNSSGENICVGYGKIVHALRTAGFSVVPSMDGYF